MKIFGKTILISLCVLLIHSCRFDPPVIDAVPEKENDEALATRALTSPDGINGKFDESIVGGELYVDDVSSGDILFTNCEYFIYYNPNGSIRPNSYYAGPSIGIRKVGETRYNPEYNQSYEDYIHFYHTFTEPGEYEVKGNEAYYWLTGGLNLTVKWGEVYQSRKFTVLDYLSGGTIAPQTQTIASGSKPELLTSTEMATGGKSPYTYKWQESANKSIWTDIQGAGSTVSESYQPTVLTETKYYRRKVTDARNVFTYSNEATVTVSSPLAGGTIAPESQAIASGTVPAEMTSIASASGGIGTLAYQWQSSADGTNWTLISNATSTSYQPSTLTETTYFSRQVTSGSETAYSNTVVVNVE